MYERGKKLSKPRTQNKIRILFILKKKKTKLKIELLEIFGHLWNRKRKKRKKEIREKKKLIKRLTEDRIFRDIRTLFEQEEDQDIKEI